MVEEDGGGGGACGVGVSLSGGEEWRRVQGRRGTVMGLTRRKAGVWSGRTRKRRRRRRRGVWRGISSRGMDDGKIA